MPITPSILRRLTEGSHKNEKSILKKNNASSSSKVKSVHFTVADKPESETCYCPEVLKYNDKALLKNALVDNKFINNSLDILSCMHANEVTKEDLETILNKLKGEAKDYIIVRSSLLNLLQDLISDMPTKQHLQEMQQNIIDMNDDIDRLNNLNASKDKKIMLLERELTIKNNNISELKNEIEQWIINIEDLKGQVRTLTKYMDELEEKEDRNNEIIKQNNEQINQYKNMLESSKREINSLMKKHDKEILKIRFSLEECKNILADRENIIDKLKGRVNDLRQKNKEISHKYNIEVSSNKELMKENQDIQQKVLDLQKDKEDMYNKFREDEANYQSKINELNNECVNYERKLTDCQKNNKRKRC